MEEGPSVAKLTARLRNTPKDFLNEPVMKNKKAIDDGRGSVNVTAVVSDLLFDAGGGFLKKQNTVPFELPSSKKNRNLLGLRLLICHLLHDQWFMSRKKYADKMYKFLTDFQLVKLSDLVPFNNFITDTDRSEELVRLCLLALDLLPEGETETTALDRLTTLDSIERDRVIKKTRIAQKKAQELRAAIAKREAEEAASKMMRE